MKTSIRFYNDRVVPSVPSTSSGTEITASSGTAITASSGTVIEKQTSTPRRPVVEPVETTAE